MYRVRLERRRRGPESEEINWATGISMASSKGGVGCGVGRGEMIKETTFIYFSPCLAPTGRMIQAYQKQQLGGPLQGKEKPSSRLLN